MSDFFLRPVVEVIVEILFNIRFGRKRAKALTAERRKILERRALDRANRRKSR